MRKLVSSRLFFFLASAMVCYTSCTKTNDLTAVDVTLKLPRTYFTYTSSELKSAEVILYTGMISLNLDSILNVYGFSAGLIPEHIFHEPDSEHCTASICNTGMAEFDESYCF